MTARYGPSSRRSAPLARVTAVRHRRPTTTALATPATTAGIIRTTTAQGSRFSGDRASTVEDFMAADTTAGDSMAADTAADSPVADIPAADSLAADDASL